MAGIGARNTKPELAVRSALHARGFRFRLHDKRLPGKPDLVLKRWRAVVLVNGCFWHGHDCGLFKLPTTRRDFWEAKIETNRLRDKTNLRKLEALDWRVLTVWECALKGLGRIGIDEVGKIADSWLKNGIAAEEIRGRPWLSQES